MQQQNEDWLQRININPADLQDLGQHILVNMYKNTKLAYVKAKVNEMPVITMIDGGAAKSLVQRSIARNFPKIEGKIPTLRTVSGQILKTYGKVSLPIKIGTRNMNIEAIVVSHVPCADVLVGKDEMIRNEILDKNTEVEIKGEIIPLIEPPRSEQISAIRSPKQVEIQGNSTYMIQAISAQTLSKDCLYVAEENVNNEFEILQNENQNRIMIQIKNEKEEPIIIKKNQFLGLVYKVEEKDIITEKDQVNEIITNVNEMKKEEKKNKNVNEKKKEEKKNKEKEIEETLKKIKKIGIQDEKIRQEFTKYLKDYNKVFAKHKWDIKEPAKVPAYTIRLKEGAIPKFQRPYKVPEASRKEFKEFLELLEKYKIIEASASEWGAPAMIIPKKNATERRFLVDLRHQNESTKCMQSVLPNIDYLLSSQINENNSTIFSTIDCCQMYYQFPINDPNKVLTMSTVFGSFRFLRLAQGYHGSSGIVQNILNSLLSGLLGVSVICLIDDLLIHTNGSEEKHLDVVKEVLKRLASINLRIRPDKCEFFVRKTTFVGLTLDENGINIETSKIDKVRNWKKPKNISEVRSFTSFCSFVRKHVGGFSKIALPLLDLIKLSPTNFEKAWTEEHQKAFEKLIYAITTAPCLKRPNFKKTFYVYTDASDRTLGYCILQYAKDINGKQTLAPIAYGSRTLNKNEINYQISEKESLAVCWTLKKNQHMLQNHDFVCRTDSMSVMNAFSKSGEQQSKRLGRFCLMIQDILPPDGKLKIEHTPGIRNYADPFSRIDFGEDKETSSENYDGYHLNISAITRNQTKAMGMLKEIIEEQEKDQEIMEIRRKLEKKDKLFKRGRTYLMESGAVAVENTKKLFKEDKVRYVIPRSMGKRLLMEFHFHKGEDHPSPSKMTSHLSGKFFMPGLSVIALQVYRNCDICQRTNLSNYHYLAEMGEVPRSTKPGEIYAIDIGGPYLDTGVKYKYIIYMIDTFTRYLFTKAVVEQTGKEIANFVYETCQQFGFPRLILSDRAQNLRHSVLPLLAAKLGVKKIETCAYTPRADGMAERVIGSLSRKIRLIIAEVKDSSKYVEALEIATQSYNRRFHVGTGYPPALIMFGHIPNGPYAPLNPKFPSSMSTAAYVEEKLKFKEELYQKVDENLKEYEKKRKEKYNRERSRPHNFHKNMWVLVKVSQKKGKLAAAYKGPAVIENVTEHIADLTYIANGQKSRVNIDKLKNYYIPKDIPLAVENFTAPKRKENLLSKDIDPSDIPETGGGGGEELEVGLSPNSPFKAELESLRAQLETEVEDDDDDKQVSF